ncbi:MAG: hypothetical protein K0Q83_996 [Deltaproteobacteria bacterium]|nr:hypothetical protein [Deltaproteobacteria bacterium]
MDRGIPSRLCLKVILRVAKGEAGLCGDDFDCLRSKLRMGIDAGAHSRAAKSKFLQAFRRILDAFDRKLNLARITAKFLTNRIGVASFRCVRPIFTILSKTSAFCFSALFETNQTRQKILADRFKRGYVNSGGDDIVTRLPHIHVIVRVYVLAAAIFSHQFERAVGNHLIGVHVGGSP